MLQHIVEILNWFIDAPTVGGIVVTCAYSTAFVLFVVMARWILAGGRVADEVASTTSDDEEGTHEGA